MLIEMEIAGLGIDPNEKGPVLVLRERGGDRVLPIWIGVMEASAIALELEHAQLPRPITHDLFAHAITAFGARLVRCVVIDLRESTYFASLVFEQGERAIELDARPSDAVALALRCKAPILCAEELLMHAAATEATREESDAAPPAQSGEADDSEDDEVDDAEVASDDGAAVPLPSATPRLEPAGPRPLVTDSPLAADDEALKDLLVNLDPKAFGKYKM